MDKKLIGKKLTNLRGDRSRDIVASELNISVSALQMYENGQRIPRDDTKIKLAKYYKVTVQWLFFENKQHNMCY